MAGRVQPFLLKKYQILSQQVILRNYISFHSKPEKKLRRQKDKLLSGSYKFQLIVPGDNLRKCADINLKSLGFSTSECWLMCEISHTGQTFI